MLLRYKMKKVIKDIRKLYSLFNILVNANKARIKMLIDLHQFQNVGIKCLITILLGCALTVKVRNTIFTK